jgi:hypothetical protein
VAQAAPLRKAAQLRARVRGAGQVRFAQRRRRDHAPRVEGGDQADAEQRPHDPGQVGAGQGPDAGEHGRHEAERRAPELQVLHALLLPGLGLSR